MADAHHERHRNRDTQGPPAFAIDTHDSKVMAWQAATTGVSGEMIRNLMLACVKRRFGTTAHPIPCSGWLTTDRPMAVAMRLLDAIIETVDPQGATRAVPMAEFHRLPGEAPHVETALRSAEVITAVVLPPRPPGRQLYRKVRDRASYAFALVSIAAVVEVGGGVAARPWRVQEAGSSSRAAP